MKEPRYPVFIVGSPRSGTSILVDALLSAGYRGFREGSFLSLITPLSQAIDRHFATFDQANRAVLVSNIDRGAVKESIFRSLREFVESRHAQPPWLDKTGNPEMILAAPVLRDLWPDCTFIFAKRRAIENIVSRVRKFPGHSFEYHCQDWSRNMAAWRAMRPQIPASTFAEIDQQDMIQSPEEAAAVIGELLGLAPVKVAAIVQTFRGNRPQQTTANSATKLYSIESTGWSDRQREVFLKHCHDEMVAWGYSLGEGYRTEAPAAAGPAVSAPRQQHLAAAGR